MLTEKNQKRNWTKLNWFTITKKYWKKQLLFYILATLSCLGSFVISNNAFRKLAEAVKEREIEYNLKWGFFGKSLGAWKFNSQATFIKTILIVIVIACLIVIAHVYYAYWFANKITLSVKKRLAKKLFSLQNSHDRKEALTVLTNNVRTFSYLSIFVPNQVYYAFLDTIMTFVGVYWAGKETEQQALIWWGIVYYLLIISVASLFQYWVYKKDQSFQKALKKETQREEFLVNNRDLIIKKNLTGASLSAYHVYLNKTHEEANKRDWTYTLAYVTPAYSLVRATGFFFLRFINAKTFSAVMQIVGLCDSSKKMIERLKDYPYGLSAQKQINDFLAQPERNDIQKNILVTEPITSLRLVQVSFGYEKNKLVLNKLDLQFRRGEINYLHGANGFGKSTIINLIVGLYSPEDGEILVNDNHKLGDLNLVKWRKKIAYAEHQNLIENGLSTGQKQLIDIETTLAQHSDKEIFIFDEADNSLDENNKKAVRCQLEEVAKNKLVILISH